MRNSVLYYLIESVKRNPSKISVIDENGQYTYKELNDNAKKVGTFLCDKISLREPVIVYGDKSKEVLASFFGILYAGGFYSLVNTELPLTRIESICGTLNNKYVLADSKHYEEALEKFKDKEVYLIDDIFKNSSDDEKLNERLSRVIDVNPVYVNFTSGSTGVPKGVTICNRSIFDFIDVFTNEFNINSDDIIANQAPFDFDVSVKDIYSAMKVGATLLIVPKAYFSNPSKLLDYLVDNKATTMIWAVSALCLITTFHGLDYKVPETVNKIMFSGEVMPIKHLKQWMDHLPNTMFVNLYGPTEITCNCTYYVIDRNKEYEHIPIGKAFKNEDVFLLDENDKLIEETNKKGELCVRGTAVGLGYYNNPSQTNKAFVQNPLNNLYPELIYRTGDLASLHDDGNLYFEGRKDFQIKYMGHRIELEEIELNINKVDGVERCCCLFDSEKERLYGYYVGAIDKKDLRLALNKTLPVFMIPTKFVQLDEFPLNKNGKIDRKKLLKGE